jgi:FkbM family methyltransferase
VQVIAIEAVPDKAAFLAAKFPGIVVHAVAVGREDAEVDFYVDRRLPGTSSLTHQGRSSKQVDHIKVPMRRLDDLVPATMNVGFIKIDVEGAELGALAGASGTVDRCRPAILFESGPDRADIGDLFDWFAERSYVILVPNRVAHDGPPLCRESFHESHFYPFRTINYFALPSERRQEYRDRARKAMGVTA